MNPVLPGAVEAFASANVHFSSPAAGEGRGSSSRFAAKPGIWTASEESNELSLC
jgi:hypothetical protein